MDKFWPSCVSVMLAAFLVPVAVFWKWKCSNVLVNCWFCGCNSKIQRRKTNWWFCLHCEQYNGFSKDGDYNKDIPEMFNENNKKSYTRQGDLYTATTPKTNILCQACISKQVRKVTELSAFLPKDELFFDLESDDYEQFLNEKYKPCLVCRTNIAYHLKEQDRQLRRDHLQDVDTTPRKLTSHSRSLSSATFWKYPLSLISIVAVLWFYKMEDVQSLACVVLYALCAIYSAFTWSAIFPLTIWTLLSLSLLKSLLWIAVTLYGCYDTDDSRALRYAALMAIFTLECECLLRAFMRYVVFRNLAFHNRQQSNIQRLCKLPRKHENTSEMGQSIILDQSVSDECIIYDKMGGDEQDDQTHVSKDTELSPPDLLRGHLDAMKIGKQVTRERSWMTERNHVMAAHKYADLSPVARENTLSSSRPLLRPSTFQAARINQISFKQQTLLQPEEQKDMGHISSNFVQLKDSATKATLTSASDNGAISTKHSFTWTYIILVGLFASVLCNMWLYTKRFSRNLTE